MKNTHTILASIIIAAAIVVSPFAAWGINSLVGETVAKAILGDEATGGAAAVDATGKDISTGSGLHIKGNKDAEIYLVEYSDLECPYCKAFHATMESIMKKNEGKVAWVYKHFPLPFHPNAKPSAIAAECIATLGGNDKFWQFTDGVFTDTIKLSDAEYLKAAGKLGLTAETFNK
jgi:protein-disulfide isomerase